MGGMTRREAAQRAEGTRRRPLCVRRGTRAGGKDWAKRDGESEDWSKGGAGKGKTGKDRALRKEIGLELRAQMMVAKGRKA